MTDFENYSGYANGGQNGIVRIAGMKIDGTLNMEESFDYASSRPSFEDVHPSTQK